MISSLLLFIVNSVSTYLTHAFCLKTGNLPKDTVLVNLLTKEKGKISSILRGGKKIKGKLPNYFSIIAELEVMIAKGKNFDIVAGVDCKKIFENIQDDLDKRLLALSFFDVINKVSNENEPELELYNYLKNWLEFVDKEKIKNGNLFLALSLWRLLSLIGFTPNIDTCVNCHSELSNKIDYSVTAHGMICNNCHYKDAHKLPGDLAKLINTGLNHEDNKKVLIDFNNYKIENTEIISTLILHVQSILEFEVRGVRVYNQIVKN